MHSCVRWKSTCLKGKGLFLAWFLTFFGIWACIGFNGRNDPEKCIRLVCEKLTVFPYARTPLDSVSNSLSCDMIRFKIKVGVEEKFMCKNVTKQTQHLHDDRSDNAALRGRHMHDLDLTVNMLGLCDPSNLLFVLSAEERRAVLRLL